MIALALMLMGWIGPVTDVVTMVSLVVAAYTLWESKRVREEARRLKRRALLRIRGPDLLQQIKGLQSELNDQLFIARSDVARLSATMRRIGELVKSLNDKIGQNSIPSGEDILTLTLNSTRVTDVRSDAQKLYVRLVGFTTAADEKLKDQLAELS